MLIKRRVALAALGLMLMVSPVLADDCPYENTVQSAATAFQNAAKAGSPQAFISAASRFADINGLAMFALGPYRSKLSSGQQGKYLSLARNFMGKFMADNASHIPNSPVSVVSCSGNSVTAKFDSGGSITFRMAGSSRVSDVTIAGISVAGAMRDKFTSVIDQHGGDVNALLAYLQQ